MDFVKPYIQENKQRFLDELFDLLRIPSVSADPNYKEDVRKTAHFVKGPRLHLNLLLRTKKFMLVVLVTIKVKYICM